MNQISRRGWGALLLAGCLSVGLSGCSSAGGNEGENKAFGEIGLPLVTQAASGTSYRLRDATFVIQNQYYDYYGTAGAAGAGSSPSTTTVSSETDPDATNISVSLEEGYYNIRLLDGWHLEKGSSAGAEPVEATLLSGADQWVYVSRQSTSWAEFSFGIGGREIWLNGKLNIAIDVQETPPAQGGAGGWGGAGGAWSTGGAAGAGWTVAGSAGTGG